MATRIKTKKAKSKTRKAKAKAGKERRPDGLVIGSDGAKLVDAICSAKGATHAELKKLVGWKSCLPYAMKSVVQAKVRLRKEREGREVRFFGEPRA
jgi:predicted house-cleaning NTP pyrophosphatase (Maf/HAM1 superfamily)